MPEKEGSRLAAGAAATAVRALVSAARLAAEADSGGRTVASQDTGALARKRAASSRRDGSTATVIHDGGTPSSDARLAVSAAMTAAVPAEPAAALGTDTVSVSVMRGTPDADGLKDVDGVIVRAALDDGEAEVATLGDVAAALAARLALADGDGESVNGDGERAAEVLADADGVALTDIGGEEDGDGNGDGSGDAAALADAGDAAGDGDGLWERRKMATLRLVMVRARTPASAGGARWQGKGTRIGRRRQAKARREFPPSCARTACQSGVARVQRAGVDGAIRH